MAKTLQDILKDLSNGITPSQADFLSALKDAGWNSNSGAFSGNNSKDIYAGNGKWFENSYVYGVQLTDFSGFKHFFRIKTMD